MYGVRRDGRACATPARAHLAALTARPLRFREPDAGPGSTIWEGRLARVKPLPLSSSQEYRVERWTLECLAADLGSFGDRLDRRYRRVDPEGARPPQAHLFQAIKGRIEACRSIARRGESMDSPWGPVLGPRTASLTQARRRVKPTDGARVHAIVIDISSSLPGGYPAKRRQMSPASRSFFRSNGKMV